MAIDGAASEKEATGNASLLEAEITQTRDLRGKEFWAQVKRLNEMFRTLRPLHPQDRERLWGELGDLCKAAKAEQIEREQEAEQDAKALEAEIASLRDGHWDSFQRKYPEFWDHSRSIRQQFKTLRTLRHADRERLWKDLNWICEETRRKQESEWQNRIMRSTQEKELILSILNDAYYGAKASRDQQDFSEVEEKLRRALGQMKGEGRNHDQKMLREDHERCWERYQEARSALHFRREDLASRGYDDLRGKVADLERDAGSDDPHDVLHRIKLVQAEMREAILKKYQREDLRGGLNHAWERAVARMQERREEARGRHEAWVKGAEEKIERLEALREKNDGVIRSLESQVDTLEDQIRSAWNDEFADRARGWVEEKQQKIQDILATNRDLENKIREIHSQLSR